MVYTFVVEGEVRGDVLRALGLADTDVEVDDGRSVLRMDLIDRSELAGALTHMLDLGLDLVAMQRVA
ncbi:MAG: hypothetical protein ACXIVQ_05820 [Acidimicrobiales bacterium]